MINFLISFSKTLTSHVSLFNSSAEAQTPLSVTCARILPRQLINFFTTSFHSIVFDMDDREDSGVLIQLQQWMDTENLTSLLLMISRNDSRVLIQLQHYLD